MSQGNQQAFLKTIAGSRDLSAESFPLAGCTSLYSTSWSSIPFFDKVLSNLFFFGMRKPALLWHGMEVERYLSLFIPHSEQESHVGKPNKLGHVKMEQNPSNLSGFFHLLFLEDFYFDPLWPALCFVNCVSNYSSDQNRLPRGRGLVGSFQVSWRPWNLGLLAEAMLQRYVEGHGRTPIPELEKKSH